MARLTAVGNRNGWGASIADALSTACLMELGEVVVEAMQFLDRVDFGTTETKVSLFETTVRTATEGHRAHADTAWADSVSGRHVVRVRSAEGPVCPSRAGGVWCSSLPRSATRSSALTPVAA